MDLLWGAPVPVLFFTQGLEQDFTEITFVNVATFKISEKTKKLSRNQRHPEDAIHTFTNWHCQIFRALFAATVFQQKHGSHWANAML